MNTLARKTSGEDAYSGVFSTRRRPDYPCVAASPKRSARIRAPLAAAARGLTGTPDPAPPDWESGGLIQDASEIPRYLAALRAQRGAV